MSVKWSIPSLMVARTAGSLCSDSDVNAFLSATGITSPTIINALCTLVTSAKANGWWTKCYAIYPMVGGTSTTCSYNLVNTALYALNFQGGWTFANTGATPNGTTGYADTGINLSTVFTLNDTHLSYYSRTSAAGSSQKWFGAYVSGGASNGIEFLPRYTDDHVYSDMYDLVGGGGRASGANTVTAAHLMASRVSSTSHVVYKNGSSIASSGTTSGALVNLTLYLSDINQDGSPQGFPSNCECAFFTVGTGISSSLALTMYNDIQTFQTSLSRQV